MDTSSESPRLIPRPTEGDGVYSATLTLDPVSRKRIIQAKAVSLPSREEASESIRSLKSSVEQCITALQEKSVSFDELNAAIKGALHEHETPLSLARQIRVEKAKSRDAEERIMAVLPRLNDLIDLSEQSLMLISKNLNQGETLLSELKGKLELFNSLVELLLKNHQKFEEQHARDAEPVGDSKPNTSGDKSSSLAAFLDAAEEFTDPEDTAAHNIREIRKRFRSSAADPKEEGDTPYNRLYDQYLEVLGEASTSSKEALRTLIQLIDVEAGDATEVEEVVNKVRQQLSERISSLQNDRETMKLDGQRIRDRKGGFEIERNTLNEESVDVHSAEAAHSIQITVLREMLDSLKPSLGSVLELLAGVSEIRSLYEDTKASVFSVLMRREQACVIPEDKFHKQALLIRKTISAYCDALSEFLSELVSLGDEDEAKKQKLMKRLIDIKETRFDASGIAKNPRQIILDYLNSVDIFPLFPTVGYLLRNNYRNEMQGAHMRYHGKLEKSFNRSNGLLKNAQIRGAETMESFRNWFHSELRRMLKHGNVLMVSHFTEKEECTALSDLALINEAFVEELLFASLELYLGTDRKSALKKHVSGGGSARLTLRQKDQSPREFVISRAIAAPQDPPLLSQVEQYLINGQPAIDFEFGSEQGLLSHIQKLNTSLVDGTYEDGDWDLEIVLVE